MNIYKTLKQINRDIDCFKIKDFSVISSALLANLGTYGFITTYIKKNYNIEKMFINFLQENNIYEQYVQDYCDDNIRMHRLDDIYVHQYVTHTLSLRKTHIDLNYLFALESKWYEIIFNLIMK